MDASAAQVEAPLDNSVSCEMCEFAVTVIDERLDDEATIDQVQNQIEEIIRQPPQIEREVQFVCSYLPGTIGDKCEELVDKYGEKLIDALVKEEMDPKKVHYCDLINRASITIRQGVL